MAMLENVGHEDNVGWCLSLVMANRRYEQEHDEFRYVHVMLLYGMKIMVLYKRHDFINQEAEPIFRTEPCHQSQEIGGLRAQLAEQNQGPPDAEIPPAPVNQPAAPEIPDVDLLQRDVTQMTLEDFVEEFKEKYFNTEIMEAQQDEFDKFRQGNLSVAEAVKKFEQLARLCPHLISSERDKVRRMMRMFRSDLAVVISNGPIHHSLLLNVLAGQFELSTG
ncbi:hypothetical protein TIFTF001_046097 [Ficus carica]|uniref:Retrotransposon gag domain-containing protein n=1 Tax=Ficus carica TaxID=3494 RepID=A0AA88CR86_FICCA|nr:hypothetical protein TIFTF001_046097 [Ficus carica]